MKYNCMNNCCGGGLPNFVSPACNLRCGSCCPPMIEVPLCPSRCVSGIKVYAYATQTIPTDFSTPLMLSEANGDGPAPYTITGATVMFGSAAVYDEYLTVNNMNITAQGNALMILNVAFTDANGVARSTQVPFTLPFSVDMVSPIRVCDPALFVATNMTLSALVYDPVTGILTGEAMGMLTVYAVNQCVENIPFNLCATDGLCPTARISVFGSAKECRLLPGNYGPLSVVLPELTGTAPFTVIAVSMQDTQAGAIALHPIMVGTSVLAVRAYIPLTVSVRDSMGIIDTVMALANMDLEVDVSGLGVMSPAVMLFIEGAIRSFSYDAASNTLTVTPNLRGYVVVTAPTPESGDMLTFTLPCITPEDRCGMCIVNPRPNS